MLRDPEEVPIVAAKPIPTPPMTFLVVVVVSVVSVAVSDGVCCSNREEYMPPANQSEIEQIRDVI